jgi:hypothetical protein
MNNITYGAPFLLQEKQFKADGDWEVAGYTSTFGNVDLGLDVVLPGAFDKTLKNGDALRRVKFLHSHLPWEVLGVPKELKVDDKGLYGRFKISKTQLGTDTHTLVLDGALDSFSIGYRARDYEYGETGDVRQIKELDLIEVSLVALPMNPEAVVTSAKALADRESLSLVERTARARDALDRILAEARDLIAKHGDLTQAKRQELEALLATFAGLSDVTDGLKVLLAAASSAPEPRADVRLQLEMARKRSRLRELGLVV